MIAATVSRATCVVNARSIPRERIGRADAAILVRERHAVDLGRKRAEARLVRVRLRRQRQRQQRAAVERALERDHRRPLRVRARELDRVLDGFGAGVEERRLRGPGERRDREQPLGERHVHLVRDDREVGVEEARRLVLHRFDDVRMRVADVRGSRLRRRSRETCCRRRPSGSRRGPRRRRSAGTPRADRRRRAPSARGSRGISGPGTSVRRRIARVAAIGRSR